MRSIVATAKAIVFALSLATLAAPAHAAPQSGEVSLSGSHFLRDGRIWTPKGVSLVGFVAPRAALNPRYGKWRGNFGDGALNAIRDFHADLIRFQVSQAGLDPDSSIYDPAYAAEIAAAVSNARKAGFSVIISMQWERSSGLVDQPNMPSQITQHAWATLVGLVKDDDGVMLELFNEPAPGPSAARWQEWRGDMNALIAQIRAAGAKNVLLLDGLSYGRDLDGVPAASDPLSNYAYAFHPYAGQNNRDSGEWDRRFGNLARTHPVLATEWFALGCQNDAEQVASALLDYLRRQGIGLVGWSFDDPGTIFHPDGSLTDFSQASCAAKRGGAGTMLQAYFAH